jgi:hypothetical protein
MKTYILRGLFMAIFALSMAACNLATAASPLPATDLPTPVLATDLPINLLATETPESVIPPTPTPTPTSSQVTITVIKESLHIRRGPSTEYDELGTFVSGESAVASFRDAQSSWVYIPLPLYPSVYGWVSIQTQFTSVQGEVSSLDVKNADPAVPARIRNCTFHPMLIQPGNVLIDPQFDAPNNTHNFPPGSYTAYDQNQEGHPQVASFSLSEGNKDDINTDGLGNSYYCP